MPRKRFKVKKTWFLPGEKNLREREREIDLTEVRTVPAEMHLQSVMCVEKRERLIQAQEGLKKA